MNFKSHLIGGAASSTVLLLGASQLFNLSGVNQIEMTSYSVLFFSCLFMSLFPDLDTASIPQRWFYRMMLMVIPSVYFFGTPFQLFLVSLFSVAPLVHKHRGWTHWKITPFILSLGLVIAYDQNKGFYEIKRFDLLFNYSVFIMSFVLGHYTHLLLDSKAIKIFGNDRGHH